MIERAPKITTREIVAIELVIAQSSGKASPVGLVASDYCSLLIET
jgi:hypothetical protein